MDYENILSRKVQDLQFSGIRKFFDIAASYDDVISLSVGEPDFKTPWAIRKEAIRVLEKGRTNYTANAGLADLRIAINDVGSEMCIRDRSMTGCTSATTPCMRYL